MVSMPPATITAAAPSPISRAADAIASAPEPHTRLTVNAGAETGMPPPIAARRAEDDLSSCHGDAPVLARSGVRAAAPTGASARHFKPLTL